MKGDNVPLPSESDAAAPNERELKTFLSPPPPPHPQESETNLTANVLKQQNQDLKKLNTREVQKSTILIS